MEAWNIIFLSKWVICRFQPLISPGCIIILRFQEWSMTLGNDWSQGGKAPAVLPPPEPMKGDDKYWPWCVCVQSSSFNWMIGLSCNFAEFLAPSTICVDPFNQSNVPHFSKKETIINITTGFTLCSVWFYGKKLILGGISEHRGRSLDGIKPFFSPQPNFPLRCTPLQDQVLPPHMSGKIPRKFLRFAKPNLEFNPSRKTWVSPTLRGTLISQWWRTSPKSQGVGIQHR